MTLRGEVPSIESVITTVTTLQYLNTVVLSPRARKKMKDSTKGVLIATVGVMAATPDGVLIRWATRLGAPPAQIIFWKVLFNGIWGNGMVVAFEMSKGRTLGDIAEDVRVGAKYLSAGTALQAITTVLFPTAFILTYAANVMLCVSLSPLWAGLLGSFFLKESLPRRTKLAITAALFSISVMFLPKLIGAAPATTPSPEDDDGGGFGDAAALLVSVVTACYLVLARAAGMAGCGIEIASGSGALLAAVLVGAWIAYSGGSIFDHTSPLFYLAMILNGLGLACIYLSFSIAPRYISGAQVGLISLLETIVGPLWVFAIYGETPPPATLLGGALLLVTVATHEALAMKEEDHASPVTGEKMRIASSSKNATGQGTYTPIEVVAAAP